MESQKQLSRLSNVLCIGCDSTAVKVATDSQAALATLKKTRKGKCEELVAMIGDRISRLGEEGKQLVFVWVAGHCGLKGNELADKAAGEASHLDQRSLAVLGSSLRSAIRHKCVWEHPRCERVYSSGMSAERG